MRSALIHMAIAFSVLVAGLHLPAMAGALHDGGEAAIGVELAADHQHDGATKSAPCERSGDTAHHHHCPIAHEPSGRAAVPAPGLARSLHFPLSVAALRSHSTAPPLDPPLA